MLLVDKRGIQAFEEQVLPGLREELDRAAGFPVPVEMDWLNLIVAPLIGNGQRFTEPEVFTDVFFRPLIAALKTIARDDMGREALKAGLKSVVIRYKPWEEDCVFEDGVLILRWRPWSNPADIESRAARIVDILEANL